MLKLENIDVFYGNVQAIRGLSIEVEEGSIVALIGSNGAGKSTTLKTISGLSKPTAGKIEFMGESIIGLDPAVIVSLGIGHCPEERHLWPDMTVWENLIMGAYARGKDPEIEQDIRSVCNLFPIIEMRRKQRAGSLSGGEQQMLAIGRALMTKPKLLMFDEPSLGLAPIIVEQIADTIHTINERDGTTILLVEQNAYVALNLADKAYVLETGSIVLEGTGKELLNNEHVKKAFLGV